MNNTSLHTQPTSTPRKAVELRLVQGKLIDLVNHWSFIQEGLQKVKADLDGHSFWEPEHIRLALTQSFQNPQQGPGTELWLVCTPETPAAASRVVSFVVTQGTVDPFVHIPLCFFIWIMYKDPTFRGDTVGAVSEQMNAVAWNRGYRWLECMSAIPEVVEMLETKHHWDTTLVTLRKAVHAPVAAMTNTETLQ